MVEARPGWRISAFAAPLLAAVGLSGSALVVAFLWAEESSRAADRLAQLVLVLGLFAFPFVRARVDRSVRENLQRVAAGDPRGRVRARERAFAHGLAWCFASSILCSVAVAGGARLRVGVVAWGLASAGGAWLALRSGRRARWEASPVPRVSETGQKSLDGGQGAP